MPPERIDRWRIVANDNSSMIPMDARQIAIKDVSGLKALLEANLALSGPE